MQVSGPAGSDRGEQRRDRRRGQGAAERLIPRQFALIPKQLPPRCTAPRQRVEQNFIVARCAVSGLMQSGLAQHRLARAGGSHRSLLAQSQSKQGPGFLPLGGNGVRPGPAGLRSRSVSSLHGRNELRAVAFGSHRRSTVKRRPRRAVAKEGLVRRITSRPALRGRQSGAGRCGPPPHQRGWNLAVPASMRGISAPWTTRQPGPSHAKLRRAGAGGGGELLYQLSKGIYSQACVSTGRVSEDDQRIHGRRQRRHGTNGVPTDASPHTISSVSRRSFRLSLMK